MVRKAALAKARQFMLAALVGTLVASCGGPEAQELTPELLEDQAALTRIHNRLEPEERELFSSYVMNRTLGSRIFPDQAVVMPDGTDPKTVGEAIALMRAVEARATRVAKLEAERDAKAGPIWEERERLSQKPDWYGDNATIRQMNSLGDRYNAINDQYAKAIEAERKRPLVLRD